MLVAMDGHSASLRVGETVPYLAWLTEYGCRHGYIREAHIERREVGSFLAVEPEIIGEGLMIRVRLIPELSGRLEDGTSQTIRFTQVATEVIACDGQPVSIGGFTKDQDFYSKFLIGRSGTGESSTTDITLTPRILK
jgi:type II secretory pathway component GspD/PulD (secretin)